ncbi:MAG: hypothetical protein WKF89_13665 [Chitinophagaceae bacterium]
MKFTEFIILSSEAKKQAVWSFGNLKAKYAQYSSSCNIYEMSGYYAAVFYADDESPSITGHYFDIDVPIGYKLSEIAYFLFNRTSIPVY